MALARTPQQIGNSIRNARKKLGWSQTVLAQKTGLRQETISIIETGNAGARLDTLLAILSALDLEFQVWPRNLEDWSLRLEEDF